MLDQHLPWSICELPKGKEHHCVSQALYVYPGPEHLVRMTVSLPNAAGMQMVHQHLQASTVLLDDHYSPKLSDYCLDSLRLHQGSGPHAASTNVVRARLSDRSNSK